VAENFVVSRQWRVADLHGVVVMPLSMAAWMVAMALPVSGCGSSDQPAPPLAMGLTGRVPMTRGVLADWEVSAGPWLICRFLAGCR
jgi:hypothetical protein